jgi:hypothetical protein
MRRDARNSDARAKLERCAGRQREDALHGNDGVFLGRPAGRALMGGQYDPDPVTSRELIDPRAKRIHDSGPVLIGDKLGTFRISPVPAAAGLPVRGVDAGENQPDAHLSGAGLRNVTVDKPQYGRVAGLVVDDCFHEGLAM